MNEPLFRIEVVNGLFSMVSVRLVILSKTPMCSAVLYKSNDHVSISNCIPTAGKTWGAHCISQMRKSIFRALYSLKKAPYAWWCCAQTIFWPTESPNIEVRMIQIDSI